VVFVRGIKQKSLQTLEDIPQGRKDVIHVMSLFIGMAFGVRVASID